MVWLMRVKYSKEVKERKRNITPHLDGVILDKDILIGFH